MLDFDLASGVADTRSVERIVAFTREQDWRITMVLETRAHADHLSAALFIKAHTGAWIGIGAHIHDVRRILRPVSALTDRMTDGPDFDRLYEDGEHFTIGASEVEVLDVPGHTPADITYRIRGAAFVGDMLFMPEYGTARADFPGGDPRTLYRSIRRLLSLPDETRLFMCHDYHAPDRDEYRWATPVGEQRRTNVHVHDDMSEDDFVAVREQRDVGLALPRLLWPSIQVNIRACHFDEAGANGVTCLRIPVKCRADQG